MTKLQIDDGNPEMHDQLEDFGYQLWLSQQSSFGAKKPNVSWASIAKSWFSENFATLQLILCAKNGIVRDKIAGATNVGAVLIDALRAHYGDAFPAAAASNCLLQYGLVRICSGYSEL